MRDLESLDKVRLCHLPVLALTKLYLENHMSFFSTDYIKGRAITPRYFTPLTRLATCLEIS